MNNSVNNEINDLFQELIVSKIKTEIDHLGIKVDEIIAGNSEISDTLRSCIVGQLSRQIFMPFIMNLANVCSVHEHTIPFIA